MSQPLTRVALVFVPEKRNVWLRFGRPAHETIIDRQRRTAEFAPGAVFCRIRWEANAYGTMLWQLAVLQAAAPGERSNASPVSFRAPRCCCTLVRAGKVQRSYG